ncbi:MAG TPA: class F sortase [Candidatus Dormibacteraeota bacterium]
MTSSIGTLARRGALAALTSVLIAAGLTACGDPADPSPPPALVHTAVASATPFAASQPLITPGLDLRAAPVAVPLELRIPSLSISTAVLGVGITPKNVMDAPEGPPSDPVWQQAFWYRGSAVPGDASTATITGHVDDSDGRPAAFARVRELRPGDPITVQDTRTGLDVRFAVTETATYTVEQASDPAVLTRIYGAGPVAGRAPEPSPDGLSHLTLITCTGEWVNGSYDHRAVVYATRTG